MTVNRAIEVLRREGTVWLSEIQEAQRMGADALELLASLSTCNECAYIRDAGLHICEYAPGWGERVRYNCPHFKEAGECDG